MTANRTRFLAGMGIAILMLAIALFYQSAVRLRPPPLLELSPAVGYLGLSLLATAGVAKIKEKSLSVVLAWLLRVANGAYAFVMVGVIFLLLPINNRGADILYVLLENGALLVVACSWWWFTHRELKLASTKNA
jgi:hypothetical protein